MKVGDRVRPMRLDEGSRAEMMRYVGRIGRVVEVRRETESGREVVRLSFDDGQRRTWYMSSVERVG